MEYKSLFNVIATNEDKFWEFFEKQCYNGTLISVINDLTEAIQRKEINEGSNLDDTVTLTLHPPRMVRAYMDYKIVNHSVPGIESLLGESIDVALKLYDGSCSNVDLAKLLDKTNDSNNYDILFKPLIQRPDRVTWNSTHPSRSIDTVNRIRNITNVDQ
jgi:hypothetical protein